MTFIDTHSHLQVFEENLDEVLKEARAVGALTGLVTGGTADDFEDCFRVARRASWGAAIGLHPLYVGEASFNDFKHVEEVVKARKDDLAAIGEIGLDFYMEDPPKKIQETIFEAHLALAQETGLPVSVHSRRALWRVINIWRLYPEVKGVLHAFSGSVEEARRAVDMGLKLGFGGAMTYEGSKRVRGAALYAPSEAIVLETDCPDMAPSFATDGRSKPSFIARYAEILGQIRGVPVEVLARETTRNALEVFPKLKKESVTNG